MDSALVNLVLQRNIAVRKRMNVAKDTPVTDHEPEIDWETINTGSLGDEWDFERNGPLIGYFTGTRVIETQKVDSGEATAILFSPYKHQDEQVFIWQSADLEIFSEPESPILQGDLCKITFLGIRQFTGTNKDGKAEPRQIKQYKVQAQKRS